MKQFSRLIVFILIAILLLAVVLDWGYTTIFQQSSTRGKIEYVYHASPQQYDVVFLGSSRANNHFVAPLFEEKGIKTFNYGMSASHLFEASLLLKLMVERKFVIKKLILETDMNLANETRDAGISAQFLPYLHDSQIIKDHFSVEQDFWKLYYIPFYRYLAFDAKIGFREMNRSWRQVPTNYLDNLGYHPLGGKKKGNMKNDIHKMKPLDNRYYKEIKAICKANNIELIALMTPMCSNVKGMDYFDRVKSKYPEIHNYEKAVEGDQYFSSCGHLNDEGARMFTKIILKDFFGKS
ncbi:hypothetical protein [Flavobacterium sp.]|uniref:hypothetical protein n=1 Tax=Flavobacterium sp. TaxID=239 RepID=UPI0008D57009|nr:hypothetical protein [Flavobacterium sp.]OGS65784.1 MAG: hypothetical protein A2X21_02295 [Flavobacteria bacterium GWA2_35_26]HCF03033.1 hypothetical protein [Flavobacterium sp.]